MTESQAAAICAIEAQYWAGYDKESLEQFSMGAMGAASNICSAMLRGISAEEYREEVRRRDSHPEAV